MNISYIKKEIEGNYLINIRSIKKVKNSYMIKTDDEDYGIKVIKYQFPHFYFIFSAISHLKKRGFNNIPEIISTKDDLGYIKLGNCHAYLNKWINSRSCNYNDAHELKLASQKLGELHKCSEAFTISSIMKPRIGWYSWIKVFETRSEEILDFKRRIYQKAYRSDFDEIYLANINDELEIAKKAIDELKSNNYIKFMDKEVLKRGFCHHDYANHNVLINEDGKLNIIDFDYCILDTHIHDVASLLIRSMKDGKWSNNTASLILNSYSKANSISNDELKLIKGFIRFPQAFWQIGLQYYWEQQPWREEILINKISKYLKDRDNREKFIDNF